MTVLDLLPLAASNLDAARSQMAFTLGFHIILASLGVALPAIMLIANYRGLKRDDADALLLARRWSKVVAVTFAVGAVTGTVLSFEFGLLWPEFTGRFGEVFGVLFAIEGIFFFLEAIFVAIYIFGWQRLRPWTHFWAGVPIPICGTRRGVLGGGRQLVDEPAAGLLAHDRGRDQGRAAEGDLQPGGPVRGAAHDPGRLPAHRLRRGLGLRGRDAARAPRPLPPAGLLIPLTLACILAPIQFAVGDTAARAIAKDQPIKFAAMECVQETATHVTEYIYGRCTPDGVKGGIGIPGFDSFLVGWSTDTKVIGLNTVPPEDRPPANTMLHWAFDTMVGIGTMLIALGAWLGVRVVATGATSRRRTGSCAPSRCRASRRWSRWSAAGSSPRSAASPGSSTRSCAPRTPSPRPTAIWVTFGLIVGLYAILGVALVLTLLAMARRWRAADEDDSEVPYGPSRPCRAAADEQPRDAVAAVLWVGATMYAVFGGADFGAGFWSLVAGGDERGRRARELIDWAIGPVWEANHVWLVFVLVVLWTGFSAAFAAIFSTLFIPLSLAALGIVLRGSGFAFHKTARRSRGRGLAERLFGALLAAHPVLHGHRRRRDRRGARAAGQRRGDPVSSWLNLLSVLIGVMFVATSAYVSAVFLVSDARRAGAADLERYFTVRALGAALVAGVLAVAGIVDLHADAPYLYDRLTAEGLPLVIVSGLCGLGVLVLLHRGVARGVRALAIAAVVAVVWGWGVAQYPYLLPRTLTIDDGAAASATLTSVLIVFGVAVVLVLPALALLFSLAQRDLIQESEGPQPSRKAA